MPEIENQVSYFSRFCSFCHRICPLSLKATGCMAILSSLLFYFEYYNSNKYFLLGVLIVWLSIILCCTTTLIIVFARCALRCGTIKQEISAARTEEVEANIEPVTIRSFCYKWCPRLLIAIGTCCACLMPLFLYAWLMTALWDAGVSLGEVLPFVNALLLGFCFYALQFIYYFCLLASIPVLFTAILKLLDRH